MFIYHFFGSPFWLILNLNTFLSFNSETVSLSSGVSGKEAPWVSGRKREMVALIRAKEANIAVGIRGDISARTPIVVARI